MRQQEIESRRLELKQFLIGRHRVAVQIDDAEQAIEQVPEPGSAQPSQPGGDRGVTSAAVHEPAVPVLGFRATVQADSDMEAEFAEHLQVDLVEANAVGLDARPHGYRVADSGVHGSEDVPDRVRPSKQWFAAMQNQGYLAQAVRVDVLADSHGRPLGNRFGHPFWLITPGLIGHFVHIAIIAGKIASAVNLDDELAERHGIPPVRHERADVERRWPLTCCIDLHAGPHHPCLLAQFLEPLIAIEDACQPKPQKGALVRRITVWLGLICALAVATAIGLEVGHQRAAADAAFITAVMTLAGGVTQDVVTRRLADRSAHNQQAAAAIYQPGRRVPKVSDLDNPIAIGVRAAQEHNGNCVPLYVLRDEDGRLRDSLTRPGFALVVGDAAAGKTRSAYEAARRVLPDHLFFAPETAPHAATAAAAARDRNKCVLWLDDLMRFLDPDGITRKNIAELLAGDDHHRIVIATMRPADDSRLSSAWAGDNAELMRIGRSVVDQVTCRIDLDRLPSPAELARARLIAGHDPRIEKALENYPAHGIGEYLACGPQLFTVWQDGWTRGQQPRAAALVAAAVDCRRAGFTRPLPRALLDTLHIEYLEQRGGVELRPESAAGAWEWAVTPREAGSSMLREIGEDCYDVFGYLIDEFARRHSAGPVPESTARAALAWAVAGDALSIGVTARRLGRYGLAEEAFTREFEQLRPEDPDVLAVRNDLAATRYVQGKLEDAERDYRTILDDLAQAGAGTDVDSLHVRSNLAAALYAQQRLLDAAAEYEKIEAALEAGADADRELTWRNHANLTWIRYELAGQDDNPEVTFRTLVADVTAALGAASERTLACRRYLAAVLADRGKLDLAAAEFAAILDIRGRELGPDHPETRDARHNLEAVRRKLSGQ